MLQLQRSISDMHFRRMVGNIPGMIYQYVRHVNGTESFPFIGYNCVNLCEVEPVVIQHDPNAFWELTYPDDLPLLQASIKQSIEYLQPWFMEWRIVTPLGQLKWVQTTAKPTHLENGDVVLDGVLIDISDRKRLEAERDRFFNLPLDILGICNFSGYFRQINPALLLILGHSTEEFLAHPLVEWVHPDDRTLTLTEMERLANGAAVAFFENRCRCQNGSYRWLSWKAVSVPDEELVYVVARDVTSRKQAEAALQQSYEELEQRVQERTIALQKANQELKQQLAAIETSIDGIAILDQNQCYTYLNSAHVRLFGYEHVDELIGKSWSETYDRCQMERFEQEIFPVYEQQGYWRGEAMGKKRDKSLFPQEVALTHLENGGSICICRDITERKQIEAELWQARTELETRIEERTKELQNTNTYLKTEIAKRKKLADDLVQSEEALRRSEVKLLQALEQERELNEIKSRFITNTSHEFRTPLTTILGSAELLEYVGDKWSEEKKRKHYERIRSSVQHMTRLLDDVLTIGKTEVGHVLTVPSLINVEKFCQDLLHELQVKATQQHIIQFTCNDSATLAELDEKSLRQILENLLSNAIKYSPQNSEILFDFNRKSDALIFQICDQGIGIPKADLLYLFHPFYRAKNVGTVPGTGLGLAIVKQAVDLHSGKIIIDSELGKGTKCVVELPLHKK